MERNRARTLSSDRTSGTGSPQSGQISGWSKLSGTKSFLSGSGTKSFSSESADSPQSGWSKLKLSGNKLSAADSKFGPEVGIEEFRKNLMRISR
jgi:hypothetical protein